jgi:hypothetical protein
MHVNHRECEDIMRVRQTGLFVLTIMWAILAFASPVLAQTPAGALSVREVNAFETSSSPFVFSNQHSLVWQYKVHNKWWRCWPCLSSSGSMLLSDDDGIRFLSPDSGRCQVNCQVYVETLNSPVVRIEPTDAGTIFCTASHIWNPEDTQVNQKTAAVAVLTDDGRILSISPAADWFRTYPAYCGGNDVALLNPGDGIHLLQASSGTQQLSLNLPEVIFGRIATDGAGRLYFATPQALIAARTDGSIDWQKSEDELFGATFQWQHPYGHYYPNRSRVSTWWCSMIDDGPYYSPAGQLICRNEDTNVFSVDLQGKLVWGCEIIAENAGNIVLNKQGALLIGPDYTIWNVAPDGTFSKWFCSTEWAALAAARYKEDPAKFRNELYLLQDSTGALLVALGDRLFLVGAGGQVIWRETLPDNIAQRPLLLPNGNVVIVCDNGKVWCIGAPDPADTGIVVR